MTLDDNETKTLLARQAIYDSDLSTVAYELLYRHGNESQARISDGDVATKSVITNLFANVDFTKVCGESRIYINFTYQNILDKIPMLLPKERIVIEVLEGLEIDDALVDALSQMKQCGYTIALDDFEFKSCWQPLVSMADVIKVEILNQDLDALGKKIDSLQNFSGQLLAEKIEEYHQFEQCKQLGFDYFQGYFLSKPRAIKGKSISTNKANILQLVSVLHNPSVSIDEVESLIKREPRLSYRLLLIVNSVYYYLVREITSIRHAIVHLGLSNIKHWVTLILLSNIEEQPLEVIERTMIRAKMCELLSVAIQHDDASSAYTVGLLSTLDVLFGQNMDELLENISLSDELNRALLGKEGVLGNILQSVIEYEQGAFHSLDLQQINEQAYVAAYLDAIQYAKTVSQYSQLPKDQA